jgi:nucleoside-diphosphate-sugar epimerase
MKCFVTGAARFSGSNVADRLLSDGPAAFTKRCGAVPSLSSIEKALKVAPSIRRNAVCKFVSRGGICFD